MLKYLSIRQLQAALGAAALIALALVAIPLLKRDAFPFLTISEASYANFWPFVFSMLPHVLVGTLALVLGPLQFIGPFRRRFPVAHRCVGYLYLGCVLIGSISAFHMSMYIELTRTVGFAVGLFCLAVCWSGTAVLAYYAVMKKNIALHQMLLAQNYALTFSFALTRWLWDFDISFIQDMGNMRYITMGWVGWVMPFFLVGFYFQCRQVSRAKASG